jgi:hypothetical protein
MVKVVRGGTFAPRAQQARETGVAFAATTASVAGPESGVGNKVERNHFREEVEKGYGCKDL